MSLAEVQSKKPATGQSAGNPFSLQVCGQFLVTTISGEKHRLTCTIIPHRGKKVACPLFVEFKWVATQKQTRLGRCEIATSKKTPAITISLDVAPCGYEIYCDPPQRVVGGHESLFNITPT